MHVTSGVAAIPLLLVKLWTVSPRFWTWPPITGVVHALERLSILVLVEASMFELIPGLLNVAEWYPWKFFFPPVHHAVAWVAIGSIAVDVAVKLPIIRRALLRSETSADVQQPGAAEAEQQVKSTPAGPLSRRGLLGRSGRGAGRCAAPAGSAAGGDHLGRHLVLLPPVLSDLVLLPAIAVIGWAMTRTLAPWVRRPVQIAAVLSGALLAVAVPFLSRPGLRPDNPTMLDRNYLAGYLVYVAVIAVGSAGWALRRRRNAVHAPEKDTTSAVGADGPG